MVNMNIGIIAQALAKQSHKYLKQSILHAISFWRETIQKRPNVSQMILSQQELSLTGKY